ncbi:MAG: DNA polymerase beta subunit [Gammaproteobacteria bacterium RIFCSPHIGHO2_02_FULL_42_13]|nr:MAG: DNA polymerase beta subunit [Gammaproteobacteria bacterium RIFCSPHIGHO2_02_FULL_42_13]OGT68649.1 MAG: DNA polymerase beta subunit [Gammaproteobacteria bacterium RIFCSPLOWO2_02_FULL_42_9]
MLNLTARELQIVKDILVQYAPTYPVWVFGSRVTGSNKQFSDLDLAIISDEAVPVETFAKLREAFSESDLTFKVDLIDWTTIDKSFQKIILTHHEILQ